LSLNSIGKVGIWAIVVQFAVQDALHALHNILSCPALAHTALRWLVCMHVITDSNADHRAASDCAPSRQRPSGSCLASDGNLDRDHRGIICAGGGGAVRCAAVQLEPRHSRGWCEHARNESDESTFWCKTLCNCNTVVILPGQTEDRPHKEEIPSLDLLSVCRDDCQRKG
jgi:hypothetical protein